MRGGGHKTQKPHRWGFGGGGTEKYGSETQNGIWGGRDWRGHRIFWEGGEGAERDLEVSSVTPPHNYPPQEVIQDFQASVLQVSDSPYDEQ